MAASIATWGWTGWNDAPRRLCRAGDRRGRSCQGRDGGRSLLSGRSDGNRVGAAAQQGRRLSILYGLRSEEHTSELQSIMRSSYAVICLKKKQLICNQCLKI